MLDLPGQSGRREALHDHRLGSAAQVAQGVPAGRRRRPWRLRAVHLPPSRHPRGRDPRCEDAVPLARALVEAGLPCAEITFRTRPAARRSQAIAAPVPEIRVGAGTVVNVAQAEAALAAGASFSWRPASTRRWSTSPSPTLCRSCPASARPPRSAWPSAGGSRCSSCSPPKRPAAWPTSRRWRRPSAACASCPPAASPRQPGRLPRGQAGRRLRRQLDGQEGAHRRGRVRHHHAGSPREAREIAARARPTVAARGGRP